VRLNRSVLMNWKLKSKKTKEPGEMQALLFFLKNR
jgi:hypothetical protein